MAGKPKAETGTGGSGIAKATEGNGSTGSAPNTNYTGYTRSTSGGSSKNFTAAETANTLIDQQMMNLFGRRATAAERADFRKSLNAAEKKYGSKSGGTSVYDAQGVLRSSDSSTNYSFSSDAFVYEYATNLASSYIQQGKELGGKAGQTYNNLKNYAGDMGIVLPESAAIQDTLNTIAGKTDETALTTQYRNRAMSLYGSLAEQLKSNPKLTVRDAAADYINTMSQMLDVAPSSITLQDNTLSKALTATKDGKPYTKTLNEFRNDLRADNRFQYSNMAHQEAVNLGQSIAKGFGF